MGEQRILGIRVTPLTLRRIASFRANKRGAWSLVLFLILFVLTLCAELIANDKPILVKYAGGYYLPFLNSYPETVFGGELPTTADYRDPYVIERIEANGWAIWPPIRYGERTINYDLQIPFPAPPSRDNWLGTDDQGRDVLARVIYGFRISVLFGFALTIVSSIVGVGAGAVQGYYGGWIDLIFQRLIEIWSGLPVLYLLIILSSLFVPGFFTLLGIMLLFSWMELVALVRAEFFRARNFTYVRAAEALGVRNSMIIVRHVLPNAMVATLTYMPFILTAGVTTLTALDFLGLGLPAGTASLGELLAEGKNNLQAPWLGITGFVVMAAMLTLLVFIGEAVRDAFDPRKTL